MPKIQPKSTYFFFILAAFIYSFNNCLLSTSYIPGITLGAEIQQRTREQNSSSCDLYYSNNKLQFSVTSLFLVRN